MRDTRHSTECFECFDESRVNGACQRIEVGVITSTSTGSNLSQLDAVEGVMFMSDAAAAERGTGFDALSIMIERRHKLEVVH